MLNVVEVRTHPRYGFRFAVVQGTPADHASWWSFDDEQVVRDRWWHPKAGDVVLDIGAAFGSYALPALAAGAEVVCFSPADFDTELLEKNLALNPELAPRCLVVRDGIHEHNGWFDPDISAFSETYDKGGILPVRSLDSFLDERPGIGHVDLIKLDIEGAEDFALAGARGTLRSYKPDVLVECHNFHDRDKERKVHDIMKALGVGYRMEGPVPHGVVSHAFFSVR